MCLCPSPSPCCSVFVVDDVAGAIAITASVVDVDQTIVTFAMPPSQGRKRIYVQVDGQVGAFSASGIGTLLPAWLGDPGLLQAFPTQSWWVP